MLPLKDLTPSRSTPMVVFILIAINVLAFLFELSLNQRELRRFIFNYGVVPIYFFADTAPLGLPDRELMLPILSSMFLHGGWAHILGNMWFLWIFGNNVEGRLGHGRFAVFYLLSGLGATLAHSLFNMDSRIPTIGASGAIAGVLGGYLITFPHSRILTLVPFIFLMTLEIPAIFVIGEWFITQLFNGTAAIVDPRHVSGVAWWAHIGGFVMGIVLMKVMRPPQRNTWDEPDPDYHRWS